MIDDSRNIMQNPILITGPTASGKSSLALEIARRCNGVIINADSMQVYDQLNILTSRPDEISLGKVPHFLYGSVSPKDIYSVGLWRDAVKDLFSQGMIGKLRPIFVGGTGLYFRSLTRGLSFIPQVPENIRLYWRSRLEKEGIVSLYQILKDKDPEVADRLAASDTQRILRALEVFEASGQSILFWQHIRSDPLVDISSACMIVLQPEYKDLCTYIRIRLNNMMDQGVIEEVKNFLAMNLDPSLPAMKAIGLQEISSFLLQEISLEDALEKIALATQNYAKRQFTWFRHQLEPQWIKVASKSDALRCISF